MPDELTVKMDVRRIVLSIAKPLTVDGKEITTPRQLDPAWTLGPPFPIDMDKTKIEGDLPPKLDLYVKKLKPKSSFTPGDIKENMTVGDLAELVWNKVK
jgi:hypothetical protein